MKSILNGALSVCVTLLMTNAADAAVISGSITDWTESGPYQIIGDETNSVTMWWSKNTSDLGWFYGSNSTNDSDVAHAAGVTDITQISDASLLSYETGYIGPLCDADCDSDGVGEFVVWQNINSGHYGVLRIDDIVGGEVLNGTWWFQTDGSGDFSSSVVPVPPAAWLLGSALFGLVGVSRFRKA